MNRSQIQLRFGILNTARSALLPLGVTTFLWATRLNPVTLVQVLLCLALLVIPWHSYLNWRGRKTEELPVFAIIGFMYWLYYALALFWGDLTIQTAGFAFGREAPPDMLTRALGMSLLGMCCVWLGTQCRLGRLLVPRRVPGLSTERSHRNYLRAVLIGSSLFGLLEPSLYLFGEGGRQIVSLAISFIPLLAFTLLFRLYLRGEAAKLDKFLILGFLATRLIVGLSSGWLGSAAGVITIGAMAYLAERRRVPKVGVLAVILFTLFFQVGKQEFRATYWTQGKQASQWDRVSFWFNASLEKWGDALGDRSGQNIRLLINQSLSRVSLLTQSANVIEQTPSVVPYQNGQMYSYMVVTFIPRFLWPNKPSVSDANRFYQVAYGVTAEEDIDNVAIGIGVLTEAFINFGWLGVVGIMILLGVFFDFYQNAFLGKGSGLLMSSLGIALLPQMLGIESQMAAYLGGIVQQVFFSLVVLLPIVRWKRLEPASVLPQTRRASVAT